MSDIAIGLISGTSVDGIDVAVCRIDGHARQAAIEVLAAGTVPYPDDVRAELFALYENSANAVARLCALNVVVGRCFAGAAMRVLADAGIDPAEVSVVGSHGQNVWHQPADDLEHPLIVASTMQIGEAAEIAAAIGSPVVSDFRIADRVVGGQGAPLAPYLDWAVFSDDRANRAVQNIGGIGNVTWLPAGGDRDGVIAFDTGPGNMLIDALVARLTGGAETFDRDGAIAASGTVDYDLLTWLLGDPYLAEAPPKSTGREYYGAAFVERILQRAPLNADLIATVTAFTAHAIADAYGRWLPMMPDEVYVNGGGARNPVLMRMLTDALDGPRVGTTDELGISADVKEAVLFALLAHDALAGLPTNIPAATGASRPVVLGKVTRL